MEEGISNSVVTVSAMKNVMWKGELEGKVKLDTIVPRKGLYGIGPLAFLKGEILVNDGLTYVSKVVSPNEMKVDVLPEAQAPFFVYGHVTSWREQKLPKSVIDMLSLEKALNDLFKDINEPLIFKLKGRVKSAEIHIQNLPDNTKVSSPKEAHQGQVNYSLEDEIVEMIGFYSRAHHGVFTHHDSNMHIHLMTQDKQKMGHLDGLEIGKMKLYLPKK
ncbi:acetolactate decarboxylase [Winogradskyella sp.]|uniref:acetolactate decarboxylase n=1 Tax=Winogradskyella sp. TaxID=1883156 RepID=UPI00262D014B|nr:acetolactate decarboxylase [Winogradskyella sp.]